MRTPTEALRELRSRLEYFCGRTDGKYDPPWAQELVGIIDDATAQDAPTPQGNIAKMREVLCGARAMAVGSVNCGGGEPWNRLVEEIDAALAAKPRVCDAYSAKDLKMIVYSEMGRHCMEGRLSKDCLEITKAVADSVIDGMTAEMNDNGEE